MFDTMLINIDKMQAIVAGMSALIGAIVTLVITSIREYKRIRKEIAAEEFKEIAHDASELVDSGELELF